MLFCQNPQVPLHVSRCCICNRKSTCARFKKWYGLHKEEYTSFVIKQVEKYPDKYELRSDVMTTKKKSNRGPKRVIVIDKKTKECEVMNYNDLKELNATAVKKMQNKKIIDLGSKEHEIIVTVKLKSKAFNGKINTSKKTAK